MGSAPLHQTESTRGSTVAEAEETAVAEGGAGAVGEENSAGAVSEQCAGALAEQREGAVSEQRAGALAEKNSAAGPEAGADATVVVVSADGAPSAWQFRLAVLQHHKLVFRVARALTRNAQDAEDVTQEAFMRYWEQGGGVRRPREWLLQVARNACLDRLRSAGRWVDHGADAALELPDHRDPAWHYQQGELSTRLDRLIDRLPEPQRSLIVLFDVHGVTGDACARILGISANQVKVYLHRARRRLRSKLEQSR